MLRSVLVRVVLALGLSLGALIPFGVPVRPAFAAAASQNIAIIPSATGRTNLGGVLNTSGFPAGYAPTFTQILPETIRDAAANPLTGFDTAVLVGICDIGPVFLANAQFKARIESFVTAGGKLIIWDSECTSTDYTNFVYPFTTNNPGQNGQAVGTLVDVEENTLSSNVPASPRFVNTAAISTQTDAVGDANVMVTRNQNWCVDMTAQNINQVTGPVHTYARLGAGLIIYSGLDKDLIAGPGPGPGFDPTSPSGIVHLQRIWLLELLQPFNPDSLPCGLRVFGLALAPKQATNPIGTSHTVTATVSTNGSPTAGVTVTFTVTAGPNVGRTGTGVTNAAGQATFTYVGSGGVGTDTIQASATLAGGAAPTVVSDTATKTWETPGGNPNPGATPELSSVALFGSGVLGLAGYAVLRLRRRREDEN